MRGRVDLVVDKLTDDVYVTAEELARAITFVAEKFLPPEGKAVTWVASKLGADLPRKVADHIIVLLIPKGALDEINGTIRNVLGGLEPLKKAVMEAIDEILAGIEAEVHDVLAPELKTLFAQLSPLDGSPGGGLAPVGHVEPELAASPGQPLPQDLRGELAGELGADFGDVRVHADAHSARAADTLGAKAFTVGRDVFFGPGRYAPATPEGRRLLAHELTHVVQQAQGAPAGTVQRDPKDTVKRKLGRMLAQSIVAAARGKKTKLEKSVDHFIAEVTLFYRDAIRTAKKKYPNATPSRIGQIAEAEVLKQIPKLARANKLDPGYIDTGNFPAGVTGPRGGVISMEAGSVEYRFTLELKKSPKADRRSQTQAHTVAVEEGVNFPEGMFYYKIYGEGFRGSGIKTIKQLKPPEEAAKKKKKK